MGLRRMTIDANPHPAKGRLTERLAGIGVLTKRHRGVCSSGFALAGAVPLILIALLSAATDVPPFFDSCFSFADTGERVSIPGCGGNTGGTSETRAGRALRLVRVEGTALGLTLFGLKGAYGPKPSLVLTASALLFLITPLLVVGASGLMTLGSAVCLLASYLCAPPGP
jgi:hypothetical protein